MAGHDAVKEGEPVSRDAHKTPELHTYEEEGNLSAHGDNAELPHSMAVESA